MTGFSAFMKKEWMECRRSSKIYILLGIFVLLGILGPVMALYTPELLKYVAEASGTDMLGDLITEARSLDSWIQFFKNIGQIGLIVMVIMYAGSFSYEYAGGKLTNLVSKGLSRSAVVMAKLIVTSVSFTFYYFLSMLATLIMTEVFWPGSYCGRELMASALLWLYGIMLICVLMLGGAIFKRFIGNLLFTGGFVILLLIPTIITQLDKYNPSSLSSYNVVYIDGVIELDFFMWPAIIAGIICVASIVAAMIVIKRKKL